MTTNKLVRDYKGNLVPKAKARSILGKYYVEGESCFQMPDGQWYRITSADKIIYDHYLQTYVLRESTRLKKGIINAAGEEGFFSDNDFSVTIRDSISRGSVPKDCLNGEVAEALGYKESITDGIFYLSSNLTAADYKDWFNKKNIPANERCKSYNLESEPEKKAQLEKAYKDMKIRISPMAKSLAKYLNGYTFGAEFEVINGFLPRRIRQKYAVQALKDGSLRHEEGEGIEFVTMPMSGAKGIEVIRGLCSELTKRCEVNNFCSVHFHFGNVKKDKLYVLSLYKLVTMLQTELIRYFPYSRVNTIKQDGKVYCKPLRDLGISYSKILKSKSEEEFHEGVVTEFNKIYKFLNHGKSLADSRGDDKIVRQVVTIDGKKMFCDKWLRNVYTTKSTYRSVQGNKWDMAERYMVLNLLNMFFSKIGTAEWRLSEGSTNSTKALIWLVTCASILRYAENVGSCLKLSKVSLADVLKENVSKEHVDYIMAYFKMRNDIFFTKDGVSYRADHKDIERKWFASDPKFVFKHNNIEIK